MKNILLDLLCALFTGEVRTRDRANNNEGADIPAKMRTSWGGFTAPNDKMDAKTKVWRTRHD